MSWSIGVRGTPKEAKEKLVEQFTNVKRNALPNFVTEHKELELAEQIINIALDEMIASGQPFVNISGYGSASVKWEGVKAVNGINTQFSLVITPMKELD